MALLPAHGWEHSHVLMRVLGQGHINSALTPLHAQLWREWTQMAPQSYDKPHTLLEEQSGHRTQPAHPLNALMATALSPKAKKNPKVRAGLVVRPPQLAGAGATEHRFSLGVHTTTPTGKHE